MRLKKRLRLCGMLLATCFLLVMKLCGGMTLSTSALGKLDINDMLFYGNSGIYYYWPCDRVGSGGMNNCTEITGANVTWIGDSYSTGAKSEIESVLPGISFGGSVNDANSTIQACKFVSADTTCNANPTNPSGFEVLKKVIETGELKSYLVFALGTNGGWTSGDANTFKSIMEQAKEGRNRDALLIVPSPPQMPTGR